MQKKASLLSWRTMTDNLKQDVEMEVWRRKLAVLQEEQIQREKLLNEKIEEIGHLNVELRATSESNYQMALKLLDYQTKVSSVELQLRKFQVKRIYKLYPNVDAEIVLTKNPANSMYSLDVVERGRHYSRPLKQAQLVSGMENRFTVTYADGTFDTFESELYNEIVATIQEIMSD